MAGLEGKVLKRQYALRKLVGRGGMADVYNAWDQTRMSQMAVKVLRRDLPKNERFFRAFEGDAAFLQELTHPNIVRLYEFASDQDYNFIVMDWIDGPDLKKLIESRKKPYSPADVSLILTPICAALNYAHHKNIVHCDVKPHNILIEMSGDVFLTDFGVARRANEIGHGGTPQYMAPEMFSRGQITVRTDVYSLGITLYEMLSGGVLPYRGENPSSVGNTTKARIGWEHVHLPLPPLPNNNLPQAVKNVIAKAVNKNPGQRYKNVMDLQTAFNQASQGVAVGITPNLKEAFLDQLNAGATALTKFLDEKLVQPPIKYAPKPGDRDQSPDKHPVQKKQIDQPLPPIKGAHLYGRYGQWSQKQIPIATTELKIGRSPQNHLRIPDRSVSRFHAVIKRTKRSYYLIDKSSTYGVFLNGQRIPRESPVMLKHGDVIQISRFEVLEFRKK